MQTRGEITGFSLTCSVLGHCRWRETAVSYIVQGIMTGDGGALELIRISDLGSDGMVSVDSDGDGDGDGYDGCRTMDGYELLT